MYHINNDFLLPNERAEDVNQRAHRTLLEISILPIGEAHGEKLIFDCYKFICSTQQPADAATHPPFVSLLLVGRNPLLLRLYLSSISLPPEHKALHSACVIELCYSHEINHSELDFPCVREADDVIWRP